MKPLLLAAAALLTLSALIYSKSTLAAPAAPRAAATPPTTTPAAPTYTLAAYWIYNSNPPEYVFIMNNIAYPDMPALQTGMADLPAGTTLTWIPIATVIGNEPLRDPDDMKAFKKFSDDHKIKLVIAAAR